MDQKAYTIIILSQQAAKVKKFLISTLALKIAAVVLGILILVSAFVIYDYGIYQEKVADLHRLQAEADSQQGEIRAFLGKITALEEELKKLAEMERQLERDLKEVNELKKSNRRSPAGPTSEVTKKGSTEVTLRSGRGDFHPGGKAAPTDQPLEPGPAGAAKTGSANGAELAGFWKITSSSEIGPPGHTLHVARCRSD